MKPKGRKQTDHTTGNALGRFRERMMRGDVCIGRNVEAPSRPDEQPPIAQSPDVLWVDAVRHHVADSQNPSRWAILRTLLMAVDFLGICVIPSVLVNLSRRFYTIAMKNQPFPACIWNPNPSGCFAGAA